MTKWILITGSSRGLGKELAIVFAERGYNIIIHGRESEDLKIVRDEIFNRGVDCEVVGGDLILDETIEKLVEISIRKNIFILINNAAMGLIKPFDELNEREIKNNLEVNLFAPISLTKKIYDYFAKRKSGIIININGMGGLKPSRNQSIYCSTKYGLRGFTDALRYEAKENGVRVIGVHLSGMKTDMYTLTGADATNCMEPSEVAEVVYDLSKSKESLMVDEILISRMKY
ncbi:SDR family oxidoreductase [archaeon]|jgi:uncharacterized protein|nr:SDR family oxidoreductase [archaeon]